MWQKEYQDYKIDQPLIHQQIEPSKGLIGCEMHEPNGWGNTLHQQRKTPKTGFSALFVYFFRIFK